LEIGQKQKVPILKDNFFATINGSNIGTLMVILVEKFATIWLTNTLISRLHVIAK
jgi:hypothetical protein